MARPTRQNAEYFYLPASFFNDRRVKAIRARYGTAGYGLLIMLLQTLTAADYTALATDETDLELLAGDFGVTATEIDNLLQIGEKIALFARNSDGLLTCPQLDEWLQPVFEKRNRARKAALAGEKSNAPWLKHTAAVFARDGHQCRHCGTRNDLTLDHITPRAAGGSDEISNLQTLCSSCNSAKGVNLSITVTGTQPVENSREENSKEQVSSLRSETPPTPVVGVFQKKIGVPVSEVEPWADAPSESPPVAPPPPAWLEEARELAAGMYGFWALTHQQADAQRRVLEFVQGRYAAGAGAQLAEQFVAYRAFKTESQERAHSWKNWIAAPGDGQLPGWQEANWPDKLTTYRKTTHEKGTPTRRSAVGADASQRHHLLANVSFAGDAA